MHRGFGEPFLISRARVLLCHLECTPAEYCHELMGGRAVVCCDSRTRLSQSMRTTGHTSLNATLAKPVAKPVVRVRLSKMGHKIGQVSATGSINDLLQSGKHGQDKT